MSRFDISTGFSPSREPKGGVTARPSVGPSEGLTQPGVAITPPVSGRAAELEQLLDSLAGAGSLAAQVRNERARQQHLEDANKRELDQLYSGQASQNVAESLPGIYEEIDSGTRKVPDNVPIEDYARGWVEEWSDGMPEAYRSRARELLAPRIIDRLYGQQKIEQAKRGEEVVSFLPGEAMTAKDAASVEALVATAMKVAPQMTEKEAYSKVVLPALAAVADTGTDRKQFDLLSSIVKDRFPDKIAEQELAWQRAEARNEDTDNRIFGEALASMYNENEPYSVIQDFIDSTAPSQRVRQMATENRIQREQSAFKQNWDGMLDTYVQQQTDRIINEAAAIMDQGAITRGTAALPEDGWEIPVPGRASVKLGADDVAKIVQQRRFAQIDQQYPDPNVNEAMKLGYMKQNPGLPLPPEWQSIDGLLQRVSGPELDPQSIQPVAVQDYEKFIRLNDKDPNGVIVRNRLSPQTREFLDKAEFYRTQLNYSPVEALAASAKSLRDGVQPGATPTVFSQKVFRQAIDSMYGTLANPEAARMQLESMARTYAADKGGNAESALKYAKDVMAKDWKAINGYLVNTGGRHIEGVDVSAVAKLAAQAYANETKYGDTPADYTLAPRGPKGDWVLLFRGGPPADGTPSWSDADLRAIQEAVNGRDVRAERQKRDAASFNDRLAAAKGLRERALMMGSFLNDYTDEAMANMKAIPLPEPYKPDPIDRSKESPHLKAVLDLVYSKKSKADIERERDERINAAYKARPNLK